MISLDISVDDSLKNLVGWITVSTFAVTVASVSISYLFFFHRNKKAFETVSVGEGSAVFGMSSTEESSSEPGTDKEFVNLFRAAIFPLASTSGALKRFISVNLGHDAILTVCK